MKWLDKGQPWNEKKTQQQKFFKYKILALTVDQLD
jgi:hypothetical protein